MLTVTGTLKTPAGQALANTTVRFYALETSGSVLKGTSGEFTTDVAGTYSVDLEPGYHRVTLQLPNTRPADIGNIQVEVGTVAGTLNALLMASEMSRAGSPLADAVLSVLATAEAVRDESAQILQSVQVAANTATEAAQSAAASGEQAAQSLSDLNAQATVEPGADKIPRADAQGKINSDWLTYELPAILQQKTVSPVAVQVYDTSRDRGSDAWRYDKSSSLYNDEVQTGRYLGDLTNWGNTVAAVGDWWHQETNGLHYRVDTVDADGTIATFSQIYRGARREFPAVVGLVADGTYITLYDCDSPEVKMWLVFPATPILSFKMMSGILYIGRTTSVREINFLKDTHAYIDTTGKVMDANPIAQAKVSNIWLSGSKDTSITIVNTNINDIDMIVRKKALVDFKTGLQIPTAAFATNAGTTVIKDDGTVASATSATGHNRVKFLGDRMWLGRKGIDLVEFGPIPDITATSDIWRDGYYSTKAYPAEALAILAGTGKNLLADSAIAGTGGVALIAENPSSPSDGMVAHITSRSNTGWMMNGTKLAVLCDTGIGSISAPDRVTNGTFDNDLSGWTAGAGWVFDSGTARSSVSYGGYLTQSPFNEVGTLYKVTFENVGIAGGAVYINTGSGYVTQLGVLPSLGTFSLYHKCISVSDVLAFAGASGYAIDNVSVKEVTPDRSGNNNHLDIVGTLTRAAIGSGEIAALSGFSPINYLKTDSNPLEAVGTGDFWVTGWIDMTGNVAYGNIYSINAPAMTDKTGLIIFYRGTAGSPASTIGVAITNSIGFATYTYSTSGSYNENSGVAHFYIVRKSGVIYIYINGEINASGANAGTITSADAAGYYIGLSNAALACSEIKAGAGAPSPEQIRKYYEDERAMMEGKATLYGNSDDVTAVAHDPVTGLRHVGTLDGRSVFKNLTNVDHTTAPVTSSISAVNGFVMEG